MATGLKDCDIIMKGGITSGVVYPRAILRMSEHYRFRSIGGTSAGAIAAVITAAAEYNRDGGGYDTIAKIPGEVQSKLQTLFQPAPPLRKVFDAALLVLDRKTMRAVLKLLFGYGPQFIGWLVIGILLAVVAALLGNALAGILLLVICAAAGLLFLVYKLVTTTLRDLVANDFGFCPGPTQPGSRDPAISDWLADKIEIAAGRMAPGGARPTTPLTFNDIWRGKDGHGDATARAIDLRMMTTNLSLRRPNALPAMDGNHYFRREDFARLFPDWVVNYLVAKAEENAAARQTSEGADGEDAAGDPPGFHRFPANGDLPLVVAARMSLSFPILFTTVPLYRHDYPREHKTGEAPIMQRMLFSDGGLSSNFPVHFFDALLPRRPTFGISLEEYDEDNPRRVHLPMKAGGGIWLDHVTIESLPNFLSALINAAKDWQDRLQSTLPGYRERIASVYLKKTEGGLNLTMPKETIDLLGQFGDRAGALTTGAPLSPDDKDVFDFSDHRWRRYLVAFARVEQTLQQAATVWNDTADPTRDFIKGYMGQARSYKSDPPWPEKVFARFDALMQHVGGWQEPLGTAKGGRIPRPATDMRITPIA